MKRPFPIKSFIFFVVVAIASMIFVSWTNSRYPTREVTPSERAEEWRQEKLERERAKNYVENIKPYISKE